MDSLKQKVKESASFYKEFLNFDYQLAEYKFQDIKPFFKGPLALELGPASGYMTKSLVKEFETLHIVEGSEELLNQIPNYPNVVKYHSFFEEFETKQQYDTIIMSHVLEHIENPDLVLKRIYNWLDTNGVFIVSVPNAKSIHRMVAVEMGMLSSIYELNARDHELGHYRVYDLDTLQKDVINAGFKVKQTGGIFFKPLSNLQIENNWTPEMIQGFYQVGKHFPENCAEIFVVCSR